MSCGDYRRHPPSPLAAVISMRNSSKFMVGVERSFGSKGSWAFGAIVLVASLLVAILAVAAESLVTGTMVVAAVAVVAICCLGPPIIGRVPKLSPGFVYAVLTFINIGVGALAWIGTPRELSGPGLDRTLIVHALWVVAAGIACFWVGYFVLNAPKTIATFVPGPIASSAVLIALFCVGLLATGYLLAAGQLGYAALFNGHQTIAWWSQWVQTLSTL